MFEGICNNTVSVKNDQSKLTHSTVMENNYITDRLLCIMYNLVRSINKRQNKLLSRMQKQNYRKC
jgi:hypothetical protein